MDTQLLVTTLVITSAIIITSLLLIWKGVHKKALKIFLVIFIIMQLAAYLGDINIIKVVIPHRDGGTSYQIITSSLIPLLFSFVLNFARNKVVKQRVK